MLQQAIGPFFLSRVLETSSSSFHCDISDYLRVHFGMSQEKMAAKEIIEHTFGSYMETKEQPLAFGSSVCKSKKKSPLSESNKGPSDDNRTITVRRSKPTELRRD
jgi:hypothetical protein